MSLNALFNPLFGIAVGIVSFSSTPVMAQETWQQPPEPIASMLDQPWYPGVSIAPNQQWLVSLERPPLTQLSELARPRLRLAGLQLNPEGAGHQFVKCVTHVEVQQIAASCIGNQQQAFVV